MDGKRKGLQGSFTRRRSERGKAITPADTTEGRASRTRRSRASRGDYHLAPSELVEAIAVRALYSNGGAIETQRRLYLEILDQLKGEVKDLRISKGRMREVLLSSKRVRADVRYATKTLDTPVKNCPVCRNPVSDVLNETLDGGRIVAGYRCTRCPFWTPLRRRVPSRYVFRIASR